MEAKPSLSAFKERLNMQKMSISLMSLENEAAQSYLKFMPQSLFSSAQREEDLESLRIEDSEE